VAAASSRGKFSGRMPLPHEFQAIDHFLNRFLLEDTAADGTMQKETNEKSGGAR